MEKMSRKVLLVGNNHMKIPNTPRSSKYQLINCKAFPLGRFPLEKIWSPLESLATWQPVLQDYQLIHAFNSIPYTNKSWVGTFELFLPYILSGHKGKQLKHALKEQLTERLALKNCRKLIAMSEWAKYRLINHLKNFQNLDKIINKLEVIHPNFPVKSEHPKKYTNESVIHLIFVGAHFARKGGVVALRVANKAKQKNLPIKVSIISQLRYGSGVPTDFPDATRYEEDLKLLNLDNVVFHNRLPNSEVIELLSQSDFQVLATLHDTYGYSVVEGFSVATPAITTNICALPEIVNHGKNGYLLKLQLDELKQWKDWQKAKLVESNEYWEILNSTYDDLANQILELLEEFLDRSDKAEHYQQLSLGALTQAQNLHDSEKMNDLIDNLYSEAMVK